jgi:oligopeptide transport system permease protein
MTKYLINRILRALLSVILVVAVIMIMVYSFLDKQSIFATDSVFTKQKLNARQEYMMQQWELFGYLDYVTFYEYLGEEVRLGNLTQEEFDAKKAELLSRL